MFKYKQQKSKNSPAFTLVELIVVIVILSILSTIAFLSFNSYSSSTRDSVRLSDISSIAKGLTLQYSIGGYYIVPDNSVNLYSGVTLIGYQGKAGVNTINTIKISSNGGRDPLDNTYYTYNTNLNKNKYQLSGFLESKGSVINRVGYENEGKGIINLIDPFDFAQGDDNGSSVILIPFAVEDPFLSIFGDDIGRNYNGSNFLINSNNQTISHPLDNQKKISLPQTGSKGQENNTSTLTRGDGGGLFDLINQNIVEQTYSTNYTNRYPYTKGDSIGVILSSTGGTGSIIYTPLEDSGTGIDISSGTLTNGKIVISNNVDSSTGVSVITMSMYASVSTNSNSNIYTPPIPTYFPGEDGILGTADDCDMANITLANGQVWSACNLGAKTAFNGSNGGAYIAGPSLTRGGDDNVNGKLYQWGRNKGFLGSDQTQASQINSTNPNFNDTYNYVWNASLPSPFDWLQTQSGTLWGGNSSDSATVDGQTNDVLRQGPCPSGWHVPSTKDWQDACNSIVGSTCNNGMSNTTVRTVLMLTYSGIRYRPDGRYYGQGLSGGGYYWSSSPNSNSSYRACFDSSVFSSSRGDAGRANGYAVRCLKN